MEQKSKVWLFRPYKKESLFYKKEIVFKIICWCFVALTILNIIVFSNTKVIKSTFLCIGLFLSFVLLISAFIIPFKCMMSRHNDSKSVFYFLFPIFLPVINFMGFINNLDLIF